MTSENDYTKVDATKQPTEKENFWDRISRRLWQLPLVVLFFLFIDVVLLFASEEHIGFYYASLVMEGITPLIVLASIVIITVVIVRDFKAKRYKHAVACIVASLVGMVLLFVMMGIYGLAVQSFPTYYAEQHPIPSDLEYSVPEENQCDAFLGGILPNRDSTVSELDTNSWLMLYGNCGAYDWDFYYPALPDGMLYLRLFEYTKNEPLSYEQIKRRTTTYVVDHTAFGHINHNQGNGFTIYEGDFECYYAARVEVWHRDTVTHQEQKLMEKVFRVDGWMR